MLFAKFCLVRLVFFSTATKSQNSKHRLIVIILYNCCIHAHLEFVSQRHASQAACALKIRIIEFFKNSNGFNRIAV